MSNNVDKTKYSSQNIDNMSFDEGLSVKITELIGADGILKNPATEESIILLRRIVKLLEPSATQDSGQRQKVTIDSVTTSAFGSMGVNTAVLGNSVTIGAPTFPATIAPIYIWEAPVEQRWRVIDAARNTYSNSIRNKLTFT
jgi:hypothetical protein